MAGLPMFSLGRLRQIYDAIRSGVLTVTDPAPAMDLAQAQHVLELALADYSRLRGEYWAQIYDTVEQFALGKASPTGYKNRIKKLMLETWTKVADVAWQDGGAELPVDKKTNRWLTNRMNAELGYIDNTFENLVLLRKDLKGESEIAIQQEAIHQAFQRADGYANTLDGVYSQIKVMAAGAKMLTFVGEDGEESCTDCRHYKGKRRKASWWVANDAVPPNRGFECGGYRCQHVLVDDGGQIWTL